MAQVTGEIWARAGTSVLPHRLTTMPTTREPASRTALVRRARRAARVGGIEAALTDREAEEVIAELRKME